MGSKNVDDRIAERPRLHQKMFKVILENVQGYTAIVLG